MTDPILAAQPVESGAYRYFFQYAHEADDVPIFAGELLGVYGVSMTKYLSKPGDMTFSMRLDGWINSPDEFTPPADVILPITEPYRNSIWVYRNDRLVWAGIIISRTWQSEGRVMNWTARTHEAYFRRVHYNNNPTFSAGDWPANLLWQVVRRGINQGPVGENIQVDTWIHDPGKPGYPREIDISSGTFSGPTFPLEGDYIKAYTISEHMDQALKLGAEYRMVPFEVLTGNVVTDRRIRMETGQVDGVESHLVGKSTSQITGVFQYPGSIYRYWWPESMGESNSVGLAYVIRGVFNGTVSTPARDFYIVDVKSRLRSSLRFNFETSSQAEIDSISNNIWQERIPPAVNPTFELDISHPDVSPYPEDLDVGDYVKFIVNDPIRFGNETVTRIRRVVGWSLKPPSSDGVEQFGIQTEQGGDDV